MKAALTSTVAARARAFREVVARFVAAYFVVYFFPAPIALVFCSVEQLDRYGEWSTRRWTPVVSLVGRALGVRGELRFGFASDSLADNVQLVCFALVAAVAAAVWTYAVAQRGRAVVAEGVRVWLRFTLAGVVLAYGFAKVFPSQMPPPEPAVLLEPYGRSVPMTLLWTFMGASAAYQMFCGWAETIGALLLFSRRTAPLGAAIVAAVMANVVMLNLCYGVYVKLLATHIFFLALYVLAPSVPRLFEAVVAGRAVPEVELPPRVPPQRRRAYLALKGVVVAAMIYSQGIVAWRHWRYDAGGAPLPDLYGIYDVEEIRRGGEVVPPLLTDSTYWQHVYFGRWDSGVQFTDGSRRRLHSSAGSSGGTWQVAGLTEAPLTVRRDADGALRFEGTQNGEPLAVVARPTAPMNRRLVTAEFHWIAEF